MPLITKSLIATTVYLTATVHLGPYTRFLCDLAADYWLTIRSYIYNIDPLIISISSRYISLFCYHLPMPLVLYTAFTLATFLPVFVKCK